MKLKHCLVCAVAMLALGSVAFAQDSAAGAPAASNGPDAKSDGAPKARVLKGGALKEEAPATAEAGATDGEKGDGKAAPGKDTASTFKIEGDTVSLKSGKQLRGVKVLRVTPSAVELEYAPGQPVMKLPRRLVTNIEYQNPPNTPSAASGPEKAGGDVMVAEEISAEFNKKLTTPLPNTPMEINGQDALVVLKDLAGRVEVVVTVDPEAQKVPDADRKLTLSVPANATLSTLLREGFGTGVPALKFSLQFDKVVVTSTEAEARKAAGPVPPGLAPK